MNSEKNKIRFISDLHISPITVKNLNDLGFEIYRVTDFLPATATDHEIVDLSIQKNAVIITQDLDFSSIVVQSGLKKPSVISIRVEKPFPEKITKILKSLFPQIKSELKEGSIISVNEKQFRIRKLP